MATSTNCWCCRREVRPETFGASRRGYDVAIALAPRVGRLAAGRRDARRRSASGYTYERRWLARLTAPLYVNRMMISEADPELSERDPSREVRHEVAQLLDLVALAGAKNRIDRLRLDITDADRAGACPACPKLRSCSTWGSAGSSTAAPSKARSHSCGGSPSCATVVITVAPECVDLVGAFEAAGGAAVLLEGLPFFEWAAVFERARVRGHRRHRCDTCRKRDAKANARRLRTPVLPVELAGVGAVRRAARAGSKAGYAGRSVPRAVPRRDRDRRRNI